VITDLFLIEREVADRSDADRLAARRERSTPLVDSFYAWVKALSPKVRPGSKLGEAVGYAISQEARMRFSELLLRQPIVGRKNWLFSGSEGGARAAADWFSLIASCRLQKIAPWTYLYDVRAPARLPVEAGSRAHSAELADGGRAWRHHPKVTRQSAVGQRTPVTGYRPHDTEERRPAVRALLAAREQ